MKYAFLVIGVLSTVTVIVVLMSVRGLPGTPTAQNLNDPRWKEDGPFELSPERGRFALLYSIIENGSFSFSAPIAQFTTPDLGLSEGKYVSLFAPGLSFILIPGYLVGKALGAAQVGAFASVALFGLGNVVLIYFLARQLNAKIVPAALAAIAFLLATPALPYAVTLYQHHVTTFFLLLGLLVFFRWRTTWSLMLIWFLIAASLSLDYPNFFIFFPLGLYASASMLGIRMSRSDLKISIKPLRILSIIGVLLPLIFFFWYNGQAYGNPLQLAGTLPQVKTITGDTDTNDLQSRSVLEIDDASKDDNKSAVGFFKTRNMLNGLYIQFISPDRGMLWYAPIALLGIVGIPILHRRNPSALALLIFTFGMLVLLYSMWGDPWGGWAFGSRYLLPGYALLAVLLAIGMSYNRWQRTLLLVFCLLFCYGAVINILGAVTSNANPPQVEVLALEKLSGIQQKYTYARNWDFLQTKGSKSFVYNAIGKDYMGPVEYYRLVTSIAIIPVLLILYFLLIQSYVRH